MKRLLRIVGVLVLLFAVIVVGALGYVRYRLPNVPLDGSYKVEATPERVERGKYLANYVAACMDCHSGRDWSLFAGPVKEGQFAVGGEAFDGRMGLPGSFTAKNLTPAYLGNWSDAELYRAIVQGVSKDGMPLFPIMPWPNYARLDREDINCIIAYLRTLPGAPSAVPASRADFPMSMIMRVMSREATHAPRPDKGDKVAYGRYLVTMASCADCHTPMEKGKPIPGREFAGGMRFPLPTGGIVSGTNITPDEETGIGLWTEEMFVKRFRGYADPEYQPKRIERNEFNTVMPWGMFGRMEEEDLRAIYAYLRSVPPVKNQVTRFRTSN